jgi:hypothetical protein
MQEDVMSEIYYYLTFVAVFTAAFALNVAFSKFLNRKKIRVPKPVPLIKVKLASRGCRVQSSNGFKKLGRKNKTKGDFLFVSYLRG